MKRYITNTRKKINDNYYQDPNTNGIVEDATSWVTVFTETKYELNWVFLWIVEYPDDSSDELVEYFRVFDEAFSFTFITEEKANEMLSEIWDISVSDFVFTDNRPVDVI